MSISKSAPDSASGHRFEGLYDNRRALTLLSCGSRPADNFPLTNKAQYIILNYRVNLLSAPRRTSPRASGGVIYFMGAKRDC